MRGRTRVVRRVWEIVWGGIRRAVWRRMCVMIMEYIFEFVGKVGIGGEVEENLDTERPCGDGVTEDAWHGTSAMLCCAGPSTEVRGTFAHDQSLFSYIILSDSPSLNTFNF